MGDDHTRKIKDKRRLMLTQLLRAPVLNPAGTEVGRLQDIVVKLADGAYPPLGGLKVRVGAQDVFIAKDLIERLEPGGVRLNTHTIRTEAFQRRPGEVLLAADVLGRHLVDVVKGRSCRLTTWCSRPATLAGTSPASTGVRRQCCDGSCRGAE